ncbi:hypothetical protein CVS47_00827 [Microbacterium lemovicicum]|uniref:Bacterial Ig-like domain-containing protein n=1 Tax=Microbacterium lemovicicum TaxID=1072463 RepID=A0A3S9W845_9MICO|nr:hypothetical protein [Microbacterium lemovicicum]AZS36227.1 hypothetical protein CVS47_00827 [Microbacterium lemovicicum]
MTLSVPARDDAKVRGLRSRSLASRLAVFVAASALVVVPSVVSVTAANAAEPFAVTSPADGATGVEQTFPNVVPFAGTGLPVGDTASITFLDLDGNVQITYGSSTPDADGNWSGIYNFENVSTGQTEITATVTALDAASGNPDPAVAPATVSFTLAVAPKPANPFTVTTPGSNSTTPVESTTPTFSGTGNPGASIVITYGARAVQTGTAATVTVDADGNWTTTTDFSDLEPGSTDGSAIVTEYGTNGEVFPGTEGLRINFVFPTAPAPLDPLAVVTDPASLPLADATSTGVKFLATGFSPNEEITIVVTDPSGGVVVLPPTEVSFFADDQTGAFAGFVILPETAGTGTYTITVSGVRSERTAAGTFDVSANPVTPVTPGGGSGGGTGLPVVSG